MTQLLNLRLALWVLALILAAFGVGNAFVAIFSQSKHEVVYHFDVTVSYCAEGNCAYSGMLELANTGEETQQVLELEISGLPSGLGGTPRVLNLDASFPRSGDPVIEQRREGNRLFISIRQLTAGTLVQVMFSGAFPQQHLQKAQRPGITIKGRGRMIEGDPRGIAFARWFSDASQPAYRYNLPIPNRSEI